MKARPILFNTDMVKAILAGQKTQTRRMVKLPKDCYWLSEEDGTWIDSNLEHGFWHAEELPCPFGEAPFNGQPGDLLYVREAFSGPYCMEATEDFPAIAPSVWPTDCGIHYWADGNPHYGDWTHPRPSIHMPRWASRLTLEITDVRVERLQEINGADARAEGFSGGHGAIPGYGYSATPVEHFVHVWDSIYSNWKSNPWVWVVEFKVHHCNVDALLHEREAA